MHKGTKTLDTSSNILPLDTIILGLCHQTYELFHQRSDTPVHIQDSLLTAIGGDQQNTGPVTITAQHIAGNHNIYQAAAMKGASSSLQLVHLTM